MNDSIYPLRGVIHVTGFPDSGKTSFALECGIPPEKICMFDDDIKGGSTISEMQANGIKFGAYHNLVTLRQGKKPVEYHEAIMKLVNAIKPRQYDAIIFDTWTSFADTCHDMVVAYPAKFRDNWSPMGKMKSGQMWAEARKLEGNVINHLTEIAQTVILVTHLKDFYMGEQKVIDKQVPASSKSLERIPRLRLWLMQNPNGSPVPIALVLKRLDKKILNNGMLRTIGVLPRKLTPNDSESSVWDTLNRYWQDPIGNREATPEETPDEFQLSLIENTLTVEQKHFFAAMLERGIEEEPDTDDGSESMLSPEMIEQIKQGLSESTPPAKLAKQLGLHVSEILAVKNAT